MSEKSQEMTPSAGDGGDAVESAAGSPGGERETWSRKIDFLLACIGFSVGLGNVWRFPYLCYKNGGGAFLLPYLICVVIGGIPLFFLEVAVGQFMREGGVNAWRICPIFQGIGWSTTIIVFFLNCYYNVILCWAFYYFFASMTDQLPWETCDNHWNTDKCFLFDSDSVAITKTCDNAWNTINCTSETARAEFKAKGYLDATTEFWENKVLDLSDGIHNMGPIKWDICLCLFLAWCVVYFCIWKGIKTSGKVMYFTATSPYVFMLILLIRGCTLPGAKEGILYYLVPDFTKMAKMTVWVDAGTQIFFSYSISLGALTALGSYNKFNHNSYRDSIIFACTNSGTSLLAGFVIFSILGFMANLQGLPMNEVAEAGPGLAFIAYPKAVSQLPIAPLWSVFFFFMVILLGLDSQFVGVEGLMTALQDTFPVLRERGKKELFTGFMCIVQFLIGLSMVTPGGMYVFQLFDYYSGSRIVLFVACFECIAVAWIYGINRFYDNLETMFGFRISPYMMVCWCILSPIFCMAVFVMSTIDYAELSYKRANGRVYDFPGWAVGIGWGTAALSASMIPIMAVYNLIKFPVQGKSILEVFRPQDLRPFQLRPEDKLEVVDQTINVNVFDYDGAVKQAPPGALDNPSYAPDYPSYTTTSDRY